MAAAEEFAPGVWDFVSSEGFDEYMKALNVGMATRLIANKLKPTNEISIKDGVWTIRTVSTFRTTEVSFKVGENFTESTPDGRTVETVCSIEDNKLVQSQKGNIDSVVTRIFDKDAFIVTLEAKGVKCTRHYKRRQ